MSDKYCLSFYTAEGRRPFLVMNEDEANLVLANQDVMLPLIARAMLHAGEKRVAGREQIEVCNENYKPSEYVSTGESDE